MAKAIEIEEPKPRRKSKINTSSESREKVMIDLAMDAVEERIRSGKASASEYVHFLKLGTEQAKLEREKLKNENKLLEAKTQNIAESAEIKKMIDEAMAAQKADIAVISENRYNDFKIVDAKPYADAVSNMTALDSQAESVINLHKDSVKNHFEILSSISAGFTGLSHVQSRI